MCTYVCALGVTLKRDPPHPKSPPPWCAIPFVRLLAHDVAGGRCYPVPCGMDTAAGGIIRKPMTKEARKEARAALAKEKKKALARRADNPEFALFITKIKKNYQRLFRGYVKKMTSYRGMLAASTVHIERVSEIPPLCERASACLYVLLQLKTFALNRPCVSVSLCLSLFVCYLRTTARVCVCLSVVFAKPPVCVCLSGLDFCSLSGFPTPTRISTPTPTPTRD